jgi:hypothetical protein
MIKMLGIIALGALGCLVAFMLVVLGNHMAYVVFR